MKLVVDANSLIHFIEYYYFDKKNENKVHNTLFDFIVGKIDNGEIIVLDKVFNEIYNKDENKDFKKQIEKKQINTLYLVKDIKNIRDKYYKSVNEHHYKNDKDVIKFELDRYISKYSDLFLVLYCKELISSGEKDVILITDETISKDKKLVEKIPTICKNEKIDCKNLPHSLFEIYKDELKFDLNVNDLIKKEVEDIVSEASV